MSSPSPKGLPLNLEETMEFFRKVREESERMCYKMNCPECGRFMIKQLEEDSLLEDEVLQWWGCKEHGMYPEHLYFKSSVIVVSKVSEVET